MFYKRRTDDLEARPMFKNLEVRIQFIYGSSHAATMEAPDILR